MKKLAVAVFLLVVGVLVWKWSGVSTSVSQKIGSSSEGEINTEASPSVSPSPHETSPSVDPVTAAIQEEFGTGDDESTHIDSVKYKVEHGLIVVDGDIVIGEPSGSIPASGDVHPQPLRLWEEGVIPFRIASDVKNPERVIQALAAFVNTGVQLIPATRNHDDVLVFMTTSSGCRSYLGKVGGQQPLWISPGCGVKEITHEIMHAIGFVHEQNRFDRDKFIEISWDQIQPQYKQNFERFPQELMIVSGTRPFDYNSIMLYPADMFSVGGKPTMKSIVPEKEISPANVLSTLDVERIQEAY